MIQETTTRCGFDPEADSVSINRISASAFIPQVHKYMPRTIRHSVVEKGAHLYFAEIGGYDVGLALVEFPTDTVAYLGTLAVHRSFQGLGIGQAPAEPYRSLRQERPICLAQIALSRRRMAAFVLPRLWIRRDRNQTQSLFGRRLQRTYGIQLAGGAMIRAPRFFNVSYYML